ncbi:peptidoglycan-binding protein [Streptomyces globisporus]|uniref:peptidoglycan-binding domain-containing protein n=1 Tax=Streptomyces globisporus TaxID=1908 RepID=UPI000691C2AA|nr:peptidoglycan-binding domain-containing protein [Streptomyces globisporus]
MCLIVPHLLAACGHAVTFDKPYGKKTAAVVSQFRKLVGLKIDGAVGPETWNALIAGSTPAKPKPGTVKPKPATSTTALARQLLTKRGITYATKHSKTVDARSTAYRNIRDMAQGASASSHVGYKRVQLDPRMLKALITLHDTYHYKLRISEFVGGTHSKNSRYYRGLSFDANFINNIHVGSGAPHKKVMKLCRDLGATEVLGPGEPNHNTPTSTAPGSNPATAPARATPEPSRPARTLPGAAAASPGRTARSLPRTPGEAPAEPPRFDGAPGRSRHRNASVGSASVRADMACAGQAGAQARSGGQYRRAAPPPSRRAHTRPKGRSPN